MVLYHRTRYVLEMDDNRSRYWKKGAEFKLAVIGDADVIGTLDFCARVINGDIVGTSSSIEEINGRFLDLKVP